MNKALTNALAQKRTSESSIPLLYAMDTFGKRLIKFTV